MFENKQVYLHQGREKSAGVSRVSAGNSGNIVAHHAAADTQIALAPATNGHAYHQISISHTPDAALQRQEDTADRDDSAHEIDTAQAPNTEAEQANSTQSNRGGSTTLQDPPTLTFTTYSGATLADVSQAMPEESGAVTFEVQVATDGDPIKKADVKVSQAMELPRWAERDAQCKPVQRAWDKAFNALKSHEDGHVGLNRQLFANAHMKFAGKAMAQTDAITAQLTAKVQAEYDKYDATTDHGRKQNPSTVMDTSVTCAPDKAEPKNDAGMQSDSGTQSDAGAAAEVDAPVLQAKLTVNTPGDVYEQEADRMADLVMRMKSPKDRIQPAELQISRKPQAEAALQEDVTPAVQVGLQSAAQPLDANTRVSMQTRFGHDFSRVRVP